MTIPDSDREALKRARLLAGTGRFDEARQVLDDLGESPAVRAEGLWLRGEIGLREGRFEAARDHLAAARRLAPDHPGILHALAGASHVLGDHDAAIEHLRHAVEVCPTDARAWQSLALVCHGAGRYRDALDAYRRARRVDSGLVDARIGEAKVWQLLGELERAREALEGVLRDHPDNVDAIGGLATQAEIRGDTETAHELVAKAARLGPLPPELTLLRARLATRAGEPELAVGELRALLAHVPDAARRVQVLFALGAALDRLGEHAEAFSVIEEANRLKPGEFDAGAHKARIRGIVSTWTREAMARVAGGGNASERLVFMVGMPRSGTSLLEQMLSAHGSIVAGGEITAIGDLARAWQGPDGVISPASLSTEGLSEAAGAYLVAAGGDGDGRFTDKMPANFMHLGLIQLLFPQARVIHCTRSPADTGLSCFFQDFSALGLAWTRRIDDIAAYYQGYQTIMAHWGSVLDLSMIEVRYESLVREPEPELRRVVGFLDLPWDHACLSHAREERPVLTASHDQARRPVYTSSIGRHRPYLRFIGPLMALEDGGPTGG
jgi:tetratricopeptide (TPR) repeat protein